MKSPHADSQASAALPQQEALFTAEGAPPPGHVGAGQPSDADTQSSPPRTGTGRPAPLPETPNNDLAPERRQARIVGEVESRQGDGATFRIRKGPCTVQLTALDATIDWHEGDFQGVASMPLADFNSHLRSGALVFEDGDAER